MPQVLQNPGGLDHISPEISFEIIGQSLGRIVAFLGHFLQNLRQMVSSSRGTSGLISRGGTGLCSGGPEPPSPSWSECERGAAGQELIKNRPQPIDIRRAPIDLRWPEACSGAM